MLWNATTIIGFAVTGAAGCFGTVTDLLFDDQAWTVGWLAVDTAGAAGPAVLSVAAIGKPDTAASELPLKPKLPVGAPDVLTETSGAALAASDPHLWSLAELAGFTINATDGTIGHAEDILLRGDDWKVRFLTVNAESWTPGGKVMVSRKAITHIDRAAKVIHLDVDREAVRASPAYDEQISVDGADDEPFLSYFGIKFVKK